MIATYKDLVYDYIIDLFYYTDINRFKDGDGYLIDNIFELITPNDLLLFRYYKQNMVISHRHMKDFTVFLFYPNEEEVGLSNEYVIDYRNDFEY